MFVAYAAYMPKGPKPKITEQEIQYMLDAYANGESTSNIGRDLGCNAATVTRYLTQAGVVLRAAGFRRGEAHHAWAGGKHEHSDGYIKVWLPADHPFESMAQRHGKSKGGYCYEHRLVMAQQLGRPLDDSETVHHIDGNRKNNHPDNLQLRRGRHGKGSTLCCSDCGSRNIVAKPLTGSN